MPLFASLLLCSCSDDAGDKETGTNTAVEKPGNTPETSPSVAKEKRSDVVTQGLKGKVEVLSETILRGDSKKMASKNVFKYDEKGNMIELANYKADGKLNSTFKSIYDANGNLVSEQTLLGDGKVDLTSTIKTDAKGNKIEQEDKRGGNDLFNYTSYFKYDEKGRQIERKAVRGNGALMFQYNFTYDDNGNKTEWIQRGPNNTVVGKVLYKYDAKNNLIEETQYKGDGSLKGAYTYSYDFDKKGNWVRQKKMQDNKVIEIKERAIKYH